MSQKEHRKKDREKFLLERFLEQIGITPASITPSEKPDFLIVLDGRTVGVEITEIFVRSSELNPHSRRSNELPLQAIETITNGIVDKARRIYFEADNPLVSAKVWFSNRINAATNRDAIAELIAHKISHMSLRDTFEADWRPGTQENEDSLLSELVDFIHIVNVPLKLKHSARWTVPRAGFVATLTPGHLQNPINQKKERIEHYRTKAHEIWLVMIADRERPSQKLQRLPDLPLESLSSPFDKTFYYCYGTEESVIEL